MRHRPFRWIRLDDGCVKSLTIVRYVLAKNGPRAAFDFRRYRIFLTTVRFGANLKQEKISPTPAACGVLYSYRTERFDNVSLSFIKPLTTPRRSVCLNENRSFRRSGTVRIRFQNSRACFDAKTTVRTHSRVKRSVSIRRFWRKRLSKNIERHFSADRPKLRLKTPSLFF